MLESFYINYKELAYLLSESGEVQRMSHIQLLTLQMPIAFLKPFEDSSVQPECDIYPTLELACPIRAKLLDFLQVSTTDSKDLGVLKNIAQVCNGKS